MRRLALLGVTALVALATAGTAAAKEPLEEMSIAVCGPSGCAPFTDDGALGWLGGLLYAEDPVAGAAAVPGPYYELRFADVEGNAPPIGWVVPGSEAIRTPRLAGSGTDARWYPLAGGVAGAIERAAREIEPYAAPELTAVYVDDRAVSDPAAYLPLLGPLPDPAAEPAIGAPTVPIAFVTREPTPWTHRSSYVEHAYSARHDALRVDGRWYGVPAALATLVEREAEPAPAVPKAAPAAPDRDGAPWATVAGALSGGAALVALAVGLRLRASGRRGAQPA